MERTPNAVLHPWLMTELTAGLAVLPPVEDPTALHRQAAFWVETSTDGTVSSLPPALVGVDLAALPPVRLLLILDNLTGHHTPALTTGWSGRESGPSTPRWPGRG